MNEKRDARTCDDTRQGYGRASTMLGKVQYQFGTSEMWSSTVWEDTPM